jgi:SAM-dependent methyltransferase
VAVSFETIEHIGEQEEFIGELARVLKPGGVLILSCPNKREYSDKRGFRNEFHVKELYREELGALVARRFPESLWYGQKPTFFSLIAPEESPASLGRGSVVGEVVETDEKNPAEARGALTDPLYFVVVAGRTREAIATVPPALSVLADRDDWLHRDYEKVMGELQMNVAWRESLEDQIARRDVAIAALQDDARVIQGAKAQLDDALAQREATIAALNADLAARNFALVEKEHEVNRRAGWRWWLKLPLIRLKKLVSGTTFR